MCQYLTQAHVQRSIDDNTQSTVLIMFTDIGGGMVKIKLSQIGSIEVGTKKLLKPTIMIMGQKGPAGKFEGLLGLDFLKHFDYSIDYENQYITWKS